MKKICGKYYFIMVKCTKECKKKFLVLKYSREHGKFNTIKYKYKESFVMLKNYDTSKDYTFYKTDDENKSDCISIVEISKLLKEQCTQFELPCFEASRKRTTVIDEFIKSIQ